MGQSVLETSIKCWIDVQSMQRNHLSCMLLRAVLLFACSVEMFSSFAMLIGCLKAMKGIHWLIYVVEGVSANSPVTQNCSAITFHYLSQTNGGIGIGMEWNRNGGGETIEMWWCDGKITTISFPGLSPTRPHGTRERDPGWTWSCVSQNLGDYKWMILGRNR